MKTLAILAVSLAQPPITSNIPLPVVYRRCFPISVLGKFGQMFSIHRCRKNESADASVVATEPLSVCAAGSRSVRLSCREPRFENPA